jgi:hypothetical protein
MAADEFAGSSGACGSCSQSIVIPTGGSGYVPSAPKSRAALWVGLMLLMLVIGLFASLAYFVPHLLAMAQAYMEKQECRANLEKIALGLEGYQTKYKVYPPPVVFDKQGRPMHSWRVLILPYLDKDDEKLYGEYKLDEPWDGPNNRKLARRMPKAYACPCDPGSFHSHTSYLAVIDPATATLGAATPGWRALQPASKTKIFVVEAVGSKVPWMQPQDIIPAPAAGTSLAPSLVNLPAVDPTKLSHLSYHINGGHLLLDDVTVEFHTDADVRACLQ